MIDILVVSWRDEDWNEYTIAQRTDGTFVMSLNGQGHLPVTDLGKTLRELASKHEKQESDTNG